MGATLSTMQAALKRLYLPRLRATVNQKTVLRSRIKQVVDQTSVSGRAAIVPINIRPSEALGARADGAALPTPSNQTFVESSVSYAYNYGTIRITHPTIVSSRTNEGAWVKALSAEMNGMTRDLTNDLNRQDFGYGAGVLGRATTISGTTWTMNAGHKVRVGMSVNLYATSAAGTPRGAPDVAVVATVSGNTVTVDALPTGGVSNDYVYRNGSAGQECMGLLGLVDSTTYVTSLQGISRSTYPEWQAQVLANGGTARAITSALLDDAILTAQELGEGDPSIMITSRIQFRKIADLLVAGRQFGFDLTLRGGFKAINWGGIPIVWDRDCPVTIATTPTDNLFVLDESVLARYMLAPMDWDDEDGNILARNAGYATYDATLFEYGNLGTQDPGNHAVIRDLNRA